MPPRPFRVVPLAAAALLAAACAPAAPVVAPSPTAAVTPTSGGALAVVDTRRGQVVAESAMFDEAARADVVFVGERHDDPVAHRVELRLLEELGRRGRRVVLALEMFERDVQPLLDAYLAGRATEAGLLAGARPWPNYATDYRPLVELARARGWPVVASNAPRPLASLVSRGGLAALDTLPAERRRTVAAELRCPDDAYRTKFVGQMGGMAGHGAAPSSAAAADSARAAGAAMLQRFYEAQCVKDETMAESVAAALAPGVTVVHVNGSFHSDEGLGTVERLRRRRPDARVLVVSVAPPGVDATGLGDFVVTGR